MADPIHVSETFACSGTTSEFLAFMVSQKRGFATCWCFVNTFRDETGLSETCFANLGVSRNSYETGFSHTWFATCWCFVNTGLSETCLQILALREFVS